MGTGREVDGSRGGGKHARPQPKLLQPIRDALHALNYWPDTEHSSPSKA
jgi:hypothetical protein